MLMQRMDRHPVYGYRAQDLLGDATERVHGYRYANILMGCYMANPSAVFRAMADADPYPVKAFFVLGNNALLSYPNQQLVYRAMLNQDLVVAHEIFLTPTAQLADYVIPGDVFTERPNVAAKVSALPCYSTGKYPYKELHDYIRRAYDAFGPKRLFWGTDLSRSPITYRQHVTMFTEEIPWLTSEDKEWIMGRAVCEWLDWKI